MTLLRQQAFALHALALQLAIAADRFRTLASPLFARLFVVAPQFHLAEDAFPLHLLLQGFQRLVDVVVANDDLQRRSFRRFRRGAGRYQKAPGLSIFDPARRSPIFLLLPSLKLRAWDIRFSHKRQNPSQTLPRQRSAGSSPT